MGKKASYWVRKGKKFEDKIAKVIHNILWERYEDYREAVKQFPKLKVQRDRDSGNRPDSIGDIETYFSWFPYSIECKHHKDLNFSVSSILQGKVESLLKIFRKHEEYARERGKLPLLVFRANRTIDMVMTYKDSITLPNTYIILCNRYVIMSFDDFIKNNPLRMEVK